MGRILFFTLVVCWLGSSPNCRAAVDFARDIRPLLSDKCFACHGPDANDRQANLRLDDEASAKADRDGAGPAIVPGDLQASLMLQRIHSQEDAERMPPPDSGKELTAEEIAKLERWIEDGAVWQKHWAYIEPVYRPAPVVRDHDWPRHWIDHYLLASMEAASVAPAPDALSHTIARRLAWDLTGLPPQPHQVRQFEERCQQSGIDTAIAILADELLASPAFGERMAIYWLDLVRYADTVGYHGDQDHSISPYRDYVIDAWNEGRPFDQFTIEQLAGDLLPGDEIDHQIASGYNRLLQTTHEGGLQPKEYLAIYAADRVRNVSLVWMGATLGCAQCHDHKFDPYRTDDFYKMAAFFADVDEEDHFRTGTNELPTKRLPEKLVYSRMERERLAKSQQQIAELQARSEQCAGDDERQVLRKQIERIEARRRIWSQQIRPTMITVSLSQPRVTRILPRGNWLDETGPVVQPLVPEFLRPIPASPVGSTAEPSARLSRLDLARWLTDPEQGVGLLTARVMVNRLWALFFGSGLCRSLDDFGGQGQPPDHPELLDRLALELVRNDWDFKPLIRQLVRCRAYRQSSVASTEHIARDPENRQFARQARYRLSAEMVRDMALSSSGLLVQQMGGPSVKPYQPADYYKHLNFPERVYEHDKNDQQWRRGVYVHWQRQFLHPTFRALDAPTREECTAERPRSNTPLAALALLNDPTFVEAARVLAESLLKNARLADDDERLREAFQRVLQREPDEWERAELIRLLADERANDSQNEDDARKLQAIGLTPPAPDLSTHEVAAWTSVTRAILNTHEALTRD